MRKTLLSDSGNTLVLVLGVIMVIAVLLVPLTMAINTGHLQSITDANYERASAKAESVAVVFQQMLVKAQDEVQNQQQIHNWASALTAQRLCDGSIEYSEAQKQVIVQCTEGAGSAARTSTVKFQLRFNADASSGSGSGPGSVSNGTEFYMTKPAVASYNANDALTTTYNEIFTVCSAIGTRLTVDNSYPKETYQTEFSKYIDYYLDTVYDAKYDSRPLPMAMPSKVTSIDNRITDASTYDISTRTKSVHGGNARYDQQSALSHGPLTATGSIAFTQYLSGGQTIQFGGNLIAGGNVTLAGVGGTFQTVAGDLLTKQSFSLTNSANTIIVDGDLIAAGDIKFDSSISHLIVTGNLIAGGTLQFSSNVEELKVGGNLSANKLVVSSMRNMTVGGSMLLGASVTFNPSMENWKIGQDLSVGGNVNFASMQNLDIGGSFYAAGNIVFTDISNLFHLGGSMYAQGNIKFGNTIAHVHLDGDVISQNAISFEAVTDLAIKGSVVAGTQLLYNNTVSTIDVGGDFLSRDDISFATINSQLHVKGIFAALDAVSFTNNIGTASNELGGFYAGGTTSFPSWYQYGNGKNAICIDYNPPSAGSSGGTKLGFGSWNASG